MTSSRHIDTPL